MRILIYECKWCTRDKEECPYMHNLRLRSRYMNHVGTFTHRCPDYYKILPIGTRVIVELKEIEAGTHYGYGLEPPEPFAEWVTRGEFPGEIFGKGVRRGMMKVKLDEPQKLMYPNRDDPTPWLNPVEVTVSFIEKRLKDIKPVERRSE